MLWISIALLSCNSETIILLFLPQHTSSMSLSLVTPLPRSPSVFGALAQVTIVRTVPSASVPIAISPLPDTLRLLVCPPNATYAADGDIAIDSVPLELVMYVIEEATSLMIVRLMFFALSRLPISLGIPLIRNRHLPHGVLIEPGVRLYEGGNVTVFLLTHGVFLLSFFRLLHILLVCVFTIGFIAWSSWVCLTLLSLNFNPCRSPSITTGQGDTSLLILAYYLDLYLRTASSSNQFYCISYMFLITYIFLSCSMKFYAYASHSISSLPHTLYFLFLFYAI